FSQNAKTLLQKITEASKAFQMEKIEKGYENMTHFTVNLNREEKIIREIYFYREEEEEEEDATEGKTPDEIHTESSGEEDEISEQASTQQLQQDIALKDTLAVSQSSLAPSLPSNPLVNTPTTAKEDEIVHTTTAQPAELVETGLQSNGEPSDPLFYPSWYKASPRQASNSNPAPLTESRQVGPLEVNVKKTEASEAASANTNSAVCGKEVNPSTDTSQ
ncbi:tripartite motif-containing protein 55-like, partial [Notechis scutatus]|uniref:Tripartite motif-containing protein 55-like n=1 Tax=Notechis scutatus TaxID=8663 RepID=A0A6J1VYL8_9SAUR